MKSGRITNTQTALAWARLRACLLVPSCALMAFIGVACSKSDTLAPLNRFLAAQLPNAPQVNVNFCTDPATPEKFAVKTLIILDHSGSNAENYLMDPSGDGGPELLNGSIVISPTYATDPTGSLRYGSPTTSGTLLNYLANLPANDPTNPSHYFALVDFSNQATSYPANNSGFTSNIQDFYNHVYQESQSVVDAGNTDYLGALGAAYTIVSNDIQNATTCASAPAGTPSTPNCPNPGVQVASSYVILFMSDGSPIINISGVGQDSSGNIVVTGPISITKEPTSQILGQVQTLIGLTANTKYVAGINMFTVYYYNPTNNIDQSGQSLLSQMAKTGNGLFYNAVSGSKINYNQFLPPAKTIKYTLADIFVTNSNVVWWSDGTQKLDTDGDGLPDEIERAWGSDPTQADTNGNGVSDLVEYRLSNGAACQNMGKNGICQDAPTNYSAGACGGVPWSVVGGKTVFKSSDPDGLNDCEKTLLNDVGGVDNPDSNNDIVPDWLEFASGVPFQLGAASASESSTVDGYNLYEKIKLSLPTNFPLNQILNLHPVNYNLTQVSTSSLQDCYQLSVTNLQTMGSTNTIRVDVVEKSELLQDKYLYRVGRKAFSPGVTSLHFNDWNNATEQAAGTWQVWP